MDARSRTPTVIVARTAWPGREAEFKAWLDRLVDGARHAPGFLGSEIQPPASDRSLEWVVIYRFESADLLDRWIASPVRDALIAAGDHLADGPAREQVIVLQRDVDPVTAVISVRVDPDHVAEYLELYHQVDDAMSRAPGFVRTEMFEPVPGTQDDHVVVFTFDGRENLEAWLTSPERQAIIDRMQPFVEAPHTINVVGGFGGWFDLDGGRHPKRWKQACVVLLALYPTVMVITFVDDWFIPDPPFVLDVLVGSAVGVAVLTWVVMPPLTKVLAPWLKS